MSLPFTSLDAAAATGAGASRDLEALSGHHTMVVSSTGSPSSVSVILEGSHDGSVWVQLGTAVGAGPSVRTVPGDGVLEHLVRFVRANLVTLSGGSSPTVTATIASDIDEED